MPDKKYGSKMFFHRTALDQKRQTKLLEKKQFLVGSSETIDFTTPKLFVFCRKKKKKKLPQTPRLLHQIDLQN